MGNRRHKKRGERAPARGIPWEHVSLCLFALLLSGALLLLVLVPRSKASASNSPVPSSSSSTSLSGTSSSSSSSASSSSSSFSSSSSPSSSSSRVNYNNNPFAAPIWYPDRLLQTASLPVTSFVVVIPVRNTAAYIVNTLRSVKQSISHFFQTQQSLDTVSPIRLITNAEVVIVDDSSSDNTVARVLSFIHHQQHTDTKEHIRWKLVSSRQHLFRGTARNVGVTRSKGEVIFFLDADDVFHEDHVSVCLEALTNNPVIVVAQTGVNVELDGIHPTWKQIIENTIPHNRCLYRTFHEFVEGFPEQPFFSQLEDVAYSYFISAAPLYRVQKETMTYKFYPGNTLDRNKERYSVAPELTPPSPEEHQLEHSGRSALTAMHYYHLKDKAAALSSGGEVLSNPYWAIFSYANGDNEKAKRFANANEWRSKKLSEFMEHEKAAGRTKRLNDLEELAPKYRFLNNTAEDAAGGGMFEYCLG